jgi:hypothetical protein
MPISFNCPNCNNNLIIAQKYAGKKGRCSKCQNKFYIPAINTPKSSLEKSDVNDALQPVQQTDSGVIIPISQPVIKPDNIDHFTSTATLKNSFARNKDIIQRIRSIPPIIMLCIVLSPPATIFQTFLIFGFVSNITHNTLDGNIGGTFESLPEWKLDLCKNVLTKIDHNGDKYISTIIVKKTSDIKYFIPSDAFVATREKAVMTSREQQMTIYYSKAIAKRFPGVKRRFVGKILKGRTPGEPGAGLILCGVGN